MSLKTRRREMMRKRCAIPLVLNIRPAVAWGGTLLFLLLAALFLAPPARGQAEPPAVTWQERIEVAAGGGYRGPWRMNESHYTYVDDPTVAITDDGLVGIAWADQSRQDIFFQIYGADGQERLAEPVNVSGSPRIFSWLPRMLITSGEPAAVFLLWQEIVFSGGSHGGEIFFARSTDGGQTFSRPINLSNTTAGAGKGRITRQRWDNGSLDLAMDAEGILYAAWTEYEGPLRFSRSTDQGESFSEPLQIAGNDQAPARGPSLAVNAADNTLQLAWTVGGRAADIHLATSEDQGRSFREPQRVFTGRGFSDAPKIAVDSQGVVHLVYAESPGGPFSQSHVRYACSRDGGRTFEEAGEISAPQSQSFAGAGFPALALDGEEILFVLWELFPRPGERSQGLGFTHSRDGGQTFAAPSVIPGTLDPAFGFNGSQQGLLMSKLTVNKAGSLAIVNSTFMPNEASSICLIRGEAAK
jgi:hypothetical protein